METWTHTSHSSKTLEYLGHSDSGEDNIPSLYRNPQDAMLSTETCASEQTQGGTGL